MTNVSAHMVKTLREKTGAGMMDCKKALGETDGNIEEAVDWLRKKGLSAAAKKADRVAAEGLVAFSVKKGTGALIEVNAETDFVSRNEVFQEFASTLANLVLEYGEDILYWSTDIVDSLMRQWTFSFCHYQLVKDRLLIFIAGWVNDTF